MSIICKETGRKFEVTEWERNFLEEVSPVFNGQKYLIPLPTLAPEARLRRRLAFRNHTYVYKRTCSKTGKPIFADFAQEAPFPVYENSVWWSDDWDPLDYGRDFDFNRPFFEQYNELKNATPHLARGVVNVENSDYCSNSSDIKDCYLVFVTSNASNCMYAENVWGSKDCIDCTNTVDSELCYDCVMCSKCYEIQSSVNCDECSSSYFLLGCRSCRNCFGCTNLQRQEYCIFNVQYSKGEYEKYLSTFNLGSRSAREKIKEQVIEFWSNSPQPHILSKRADGCEGNYIFDSQNVEESFFIRDSELVRHCYILNGGARKCLDVTISGRNAEMMYEAGLGVINLSNILFSYRLAQNCRNLIYCSMHFNLTDCFGCSNLRGKQFCILNKQYSEDDYNKLVPRIIEHMKETGEWGEFFPIWTSPIPYNRSLAHRFFPLTDQEITEKGLWCYHASEVSASATLQEVPDAISDDTVAFNAVCTQSGRPFRITNEEIAKLKKLGAPLPNSTYDQRMLERAEFLGGVQLVDRKCAKSGKAIRTSFGSDLPWQIWDREEFQKEFY